MGIQIFAGLRQRLFTPAASGAIQAASRANPHLVSASRQLARPQAERAPAGASRALNQRKVQEPLQLAAAALKPHRSLHDASGLMQAFGKSSPPAQWIQVVMTAAAKVGTGDISQERFDMLMASLMTGIKTTPARTKQLEVLLTALIVHANTKPDAAITAMRSIAPHASKSARAAALTVGSQACANEGVAKQLKLALQGRTKAQDDASVPRSLEEALAPGARLSDDALGQLIRAAHGNSELHWNEMVEGAAAVLAQGHPNDAAPALAQFMRCALKERPQRMSFGDALSSGLRALADQPMKKPVLTQALAASAKALTIHRSGNAHRGPAFLSSASLDAGEFARIFKDMPKGWIDGDRWARAFDPLPPGPAVR